MNQRIRIELIKLLMKYGVVGDIEIIEQTADEITKITEENKQPSIEQSIERSIPFIRRMNDDEIKQGFPKLAERMETFNG